VRWSESGAWTSEGLSIGGYRFKVFPPDLAIDPETIDLSDGQSRTVEIRWKKLP
jgi:hypothetical protein